MNKNITLTTRTLQIPFIISLIYGLLIVLIGDGWWWQLYDDSSWINYFQNKSILELVHLDFFVHGRARPFSMIIPEVWLSIFGRNPHYLIIVRYIEFLFFIYLCIKVLKNKFNFKSFSILLFLTLLIKSNTTVEQIKYYGFSELHALVIFLAAILFRNKSLRLSYLLLIISALTKEPFAILISLPAWLENKKSEAIKATIFSIFYLIFILFLRKNFTNASYEYSAFTFSIVTILHALKGILKDSFLLIPFLIVFRKHIFNDSTFKIFLVFIAIYSAVVIPRAWDYNYIFTPIAFLFSWLTAYLFDQYFISQKQSVWLQYLFAISVVLLPLKFSYSFIKMYMQSSQRKSISQEIQKFPPETIVNSNCLIDIWGIAKISGLQKDGTQCAFSSMSLSDCCKEGEYIALGFECSDFELRVSQYEKTNSTKIIDDKYWKLYHCKY